MQEPQNDLTAWLLDAIESQLDARSSLPHVLQEVLHLSRSAAYKKVNGQSALSVEEFVVLARHFHIAIDGFLHGVSDVVPMAFAPLAKPVAHPADFLNHVATVMQQAIERHPEGRLYYSINELPMFHFLRFPELTAFKCFVWSRNTWNIDPGTPMQLAADPELRTAAIRVAHWYHRIPSTAFWAASVLDNTLSQLRYYQRTEVLTDASFVGLVHSQIQQILTDQEKLAALGRKSDAPDAPEYALYHNEIAHINNTFLFVAPGIRIALATHDHPHVLITSDRRFTDYTQRSFDRLRMRATLLSNSAEAERTVFFQKLNRKLVGVG